jgi:phosphatidylglycerophosphate synthase
MGSGLWRTRANALTAVRLVAAPVCALAILEGWDAFGLGVFALAVMTDWLDGRVARHYAETSSLGGIFDHATDATFVSLGCAALAWRSEVPVLLPALIVFAFVQYVIDSRANARPSGAPAGWSLRASWLGRWNGIGYFVVVGVPVVRDGASIGWPPSAWVHAAGWLLVMSTLVSMGDRLWASRSRA